MTQHAFGHRRIITAQQVKDYRPNRCMVERAPYDPEAVKISTWAMPSARAGRATPRAGARLGHSATITIAGENA